MMNITSHLVDLILPHHQIWWTLASDVSSMRTMTSSAQVSGSSLQRRLSHYSPSRFILLQNDLLDNNMDMTDFQIILPVCGVKSNCILFILLNVFQRWDFLCTGVCFFTFLRADNCLCVTIHCYNLSNLIWSIGVKENVHFRGGSVPHKLFSGNEKHSRTWSISLVQGSRQIITWIDL